MENKYNPIISSFYISKQNQQPSGILNVESEKHSASLDLTLMLLGFSTEKNDDYIINISLCTVNDIIHYENMVLDLSTDNLPQENMIDSKIFGTNIVVHTANVVLPENEYITAKVELTHGSQVLSTKESTAFVK